MCYAFGCPFWAGSSVTTSSIIVATTVDNSKTGIKAEGSPLSMDKNHITVIGFPVTFFSNSGASTCRKWLVAPESNIANFLMFAILVSIVDSSAVDARCQDGATPEFARSLLAANLYLVLWDWFWCLLARLCSAWSPYVLYFWSRIWKPGGGVGLLIFCVGVGHESWQMKALLYTVLPAPTAGLVFQNKHTKNQFPKKTQVLRQFREHRLKALDEENPNLLGAFLCGPYWPLF